jgi:hypothetical protein
MPVSRATGAVASDTLLDLLEPGWRAELGGGAAAALLDVEPALSQAAALALGEQSRTLSVGGAGRRWPSCLVVALVQVAAATGTGSCWPAWHRAAGLRAGRRSAGEWGSAFLAALEALGIPAAGSTADDAVLAHASASARQDQDQDEKSDHARTGASGGTAGLRLEPFGGGILHTDTAAGPARAALPEEAAAPGDRLLVFDEDGAPAGRVLPAEAVWAVHPATAELRSDVPLRILMTSTLPLTWRGWRLVQLDLRGAAWLALRDPGNHAPGDGERRIVRGRTKPALRTGMPIPGVTTPAGKPVFAGLPEVLLPPGQATWRIEACRTRSGAVLASVTATGDAWRPDALWRKVPRPLLGELTITVVPGLRRGVAVAEGLGVAAYPAPRLTSPHGLEPAEAVVTVLPGMTVSPAAVMYQQETVTREITCVTGPVVQRLAITPPHIRLRVDPEPGSGGAATAWHHDGPLRLTRDDLWRGGALRIDLPGVAVPPPVTVTVRSGQAGAEPVQVLNPTRDGRYPLRRILDTVTAHGHAELTVTVTAAPVTIATVSGTDQVNDPWAVA